MRDVEAETALRRRLTAMLAAVGEGESSLLEVIVGDRDSSLGYISNMRYDTEWFAAVTMIHATRRGGLACGGFHAAQGYSPEDASDQLIAAMRRRASDAADEAKREAAELISDAIAFKRMAMFERSER